MVMSRSTRPDGQKVDTAFGPNAWLVDEMYEQYLRDPSSVSESWRDFFADYRRSRAAEAGAAPAAPAALPGQPSGGSAGPALDAPPGAP